MLESRHIGAGRIHRSISKDLEREVKLAIGMRVMVTDNIETDLDITNGVQGEIVDIILDPDEPPIDDSPLIHLRKIPSYILVKLPVRGRWTLSNSKTIESQLKKLLTI